MPVHIKNIDPDALYLVIEASRLLGLREATVRLHLNQGKLKGVKAKNGIWRIPGSELISFSDGGNAAATSTSPT